MVHPAGDGQEGETAHLGRYGVGDLPGPSPARPDVCPQHGGIGAEEYLLIVQGDVAELNTFYVDAGASNHPAGLPARLPPAYGLSVRDYTSSVGLMFDCTALLGARDTPRGMGTLKLGRGHDHSSWDGVTTGGSPCWSGIMLQLETLACCQAVPSNWQRPWTPISRAVAEGEGV